MGKSPKIMGWNFKTMPYLELFGVKNGKMWVKQCHKPSAKSPHVFPNHSQSCVVYLWHSFTHIFEKVLGSIHQITNRGMKELAHMPILVLAAQLCPPGIEARLVKMTEVDFLNDLTYLGQIWMMKKNSFLSKKLRLIMFCPDSYWYSDVFWVALFPRQCGHTCGSYGSC